IGDMTPTTQTKILRVLQEGDIQRVGGVDTIKVSVRVVAATNKDLEQLVREKKFREDLYYRLNVVRVKLPPLRERPEDVPQIVDFFVQNLAKAKKVKARKVAPRPWPCSPPTPGRVTSVNWKMSSIAARSLPPGIPSCRRTCRTKCVSRKPRPSPVANHWKDSTTGWPRPCAPSIRARKWRR
ncbi:MAG: sigma 54-interacting transcriptional regulator, partial [Oleiharenicola lentus]